MKKILVAGDSMLDIYHFGKVNRISPEAPVPVFLETGNYKNVPGGAANVAVNIAAIGLNTELFSVTGADSNGDTLINLLGNLNIDVSKIRRLTDRRTTSKLRFIGPNNQQLLRADVEDTDGISIEMVQSELDEINSNYDDIGLILLSDYNKGFLTDEIAQKLIEIGKKHDIPVIIDVKDNNLSKYKGAYLLKPNRKELSDLINMPTDTLEEVEKAAIELCKLTECRYVLTTLGAEGMLLVNNQEKLVYSKSMAKEVFDVTGAGDTSIAYVAAELLLGKNIYEAVEMANYAAGVQVSKVGTSIVYPHEVEEAMSGDKKERDRKLINYYQQDKMNDLLKSKAQNKKIVFTNGCFDILHAGHITYLKKAKELGDLLVVGVNSDDSVRRLKGLSRPINSLNDRCLLLSALEFVDFVIPFEEDTPYELIKAIAPDVLVKGGDYDIEDIVGKDIVQANGGRVITIPLVEGKSTTGIIDKLRRT